MTIKFLNVPEWNGKYIMAMLLDLAVHDLTVDDAIGVYMCGNPL